jgi:AraC-like DNA-binding protein
MVIPGGKFRPDEESIARLAAEHFLDRGLRNLAFFCTDQDLWVPMAKTGLWTSPARTGLADVLGLSCRVFGQRFQSVLQRNPKEGIVRVKMERAKKLLSGTNMPMALPERPKMAGAADGDRPACGRSGWWPARSGTQPTGKCLGHSMCRLISVAFYCLFLLIKRKASPPIPN